MPPLGFRVFENPRGSHGPGFGAYGAQILVEEKPIIDGENIIGSDVRQSLDVGRGVQWLTTFEMDAVGAKRFDEAAKQLFSYKPSPGMVAIVLNGKLRSFPIVQSASFGGYGQISGAKSEQEAKELAIILKSGALPARLGRMENGVFIPGEPEEENRFGPEKK